MKGQSETHTFEKPKGKNTLNEGRGTKKPQGSIENEIKE